MSQMGLLDHWMKSFQPPPYRCSAPLSSNRPQKNERLSLNNLLSAFLLYGVGVVASILALILDRLFACRMRTRAKVKMTRARRSLSVNQEN